MKKKLLHCIFSTEVLLRKVTCRNTRRARDIEKVQVLCDRYVAYRLAGIYLQKKKVFHNYCYSRIYIYIIHSFLVLLKLVNFNHSYHAWFVQLE